MNIAVETKATNRLSRAEVNQIAERLKQLVSNIKSAFGLVIYDWAHAEARLVKTVGMYPLKHETEIAEAERCFPALSVKARRMFEDASSNERVGISPVDLANGSSFVIVATPDDLMILGVKTPSSTLNHNILYNVVKIVADVRDEKEILMELKAQQEKVVDFNKVRELAI